MAKSKRRPTLREQVAELKRQNRLWRRELFRMDRERDKAYCDFVAMSDNFDHMTRIARQFQQVAEQAREETKEILERTKQLLECNGLELPEREPPMPLQ